MKVKSHLTLIPYKADIINIENVIKPGGTEKILGSDLTLKEHISLLCKKINNTFMLYLISRNYSL